VRERRHVFKAILVLLGWISLDFCEFIGVFGDLRYAIYDLRAAFGEGASARSTPYVVPYNSKMAETIARERIAGLQR
jgi:hypothetical protein